MSDAIFDTIVIGGGPAGSTVANLLAKDGHRVLVAEKDVFPRFHIGESLLPADVPIFRRLGWDAKQSSHLVKRGAWFIDEKSGQSRLFRFDQALDPQLDHAFQVDRSRFDQELLELAKAAGAQVHEGEAISGVDFRNDYIDVQSSRAHYQTRFLVDASGQGAFLGRRFKSVNAVTGMGQAAVFRRYKNIRLATQRELYERGDIRILMLEDGWCWVIPISGAELSIGMVRSKGRVDSSFFDQVLKSSPMLQQLTEGATALPVEVVSNFSYRNNQMFGKRFACVGDAACFLDPVFSSGVTLALLGAEKLADLLSPALRCEHEACPDLMAPWTESMGLAYQCLERFISRFYQTNMVHNLFFASEPRPEFVQGITSILAADFWREDNVFQDMLLRSQRIQSN